MHVVTARAVRAVRARLVLAAVPVVSVLLPVLTALPAQAGTAARVLGGAAPRVLVVAVPDLRWSDLTASGTPTLWRLLTDGAAGVLSVKATYQRAGCSDGLLTLGAGDRAAAEAGSATPTPCTGPTPDQTAELIRRSGTQPNVGALARALAARGLRTAALGDGAQLALPAPDVSAPLSAGLAGAGGVDVAVAVDDQLYRSGPGQRATAVRAVDAVVASLVDPLPASATVLVVGSSDRPTDDAHLHVALARGPGFGPGYLSSPSTQRAPYVELIDVTPTVLALVSAPTPTGLVGRPWRTATGPAGASARAAALADLDVKAVQGARWRPLFMWCLALAALAVVLLAFVVVDRRRARPRRLVELGCLGVAALPVASWLIQLVPWWRWSILMLPLLLVGVAGALGALAGLAGRRRPTRALWVVTGVSAAVLLADLLTHSRLQTAALLGDSPISAGRFYGAGNTAFGVLAAAALLGAAVVTTAPPTSPRRTAIGRAAWAGLLVLPAAVVDAAPTFGADLGGALALMPSAVVLVLLVARVRLTVRRTLAALVAGTIPLLVLAWWDYRRPADRRTHIGRFVAEVVDGQAGPVLGRKLAANLGQLVSSPFLPLVAGTVLVAVLAWRRHRPRLADAARATRGLVPGVVAVSLCAILGGLLNDSGVTVTGIMLAVALPTVTALALRADPIDRPESGTGPDGS